MTNKLKKHFPMIRDKEEIVNDIYSNPELRNIYESWTDGEQKEFIDFCTGVRGVKLTYDGFFKEIMNPEIHSGRLERFLSCILNVEHVKILRVIPNDSSRIADESSLVIMDIVVELDDGQIVNVEIQKHGYKFTGQRSACYSADLLLRQYKRVPKALKNIPTFMFIHHSKRLIRGLRLICYRDIFLYRLTYLRKKYILRA